MVELKDPEGELMFPSCLTLVHRFWFLAGTQIHVRIFENSQLEGTYCIPHVGGFTCTGTSRVHSSILSLILCLLCTGAGWPGNSALPERSVQKGDGQGHTHQRGLQADKGAEEPRGVRDESLLECLDIQVVHCP